MSDVVVIGGGVIGCMTAWRLAERGFAVTLLDADAPPAGTTAATHSNLSIYNRNPGPELELARETVELYAHLTRADAPEVGYRELGGALLIEHPDDIGAAERRAASQSAAGIHCEVIGGAALRRSDPSIGPRAMAALVSPRSGVVYAPGVVHALLRRGERHGVRVRPMTRVRSAERRSFGWRLHTNRGEIEAEQVVIASGLTAGELASAFGAPAGAPAGAPGGPAAGAPFGITPVRGHIAITTRQPRLGYAMKGEFVNRERGDPGHAGSRLVWTHTPEGHVFIGRSAQVGDARREVDLQVVQSVLARVRYWLPETAGLAIQRIYVGIRPQGPGGKAHVGALPGVAGVWLAGGFGDVGIGLAAAALHLADRIAGDRAPLIDAYAPVSA
jgi:D-hydroxyproline dehydrogenase subunit beta